MMQRPNFPKLSSNQLWLLDLAFDQQEFIESQNYEGRPEVQAADKAMFAKIMAAFEADERLWK